MMLRKVFAYLSARTVLAGLAVVLVGLVVSTPASAAPAIEGHNRPVVVQPADVDDIIGEGWAWATEKGEDAVDWLKDKAGGIAEWAGEALKVVEDPVGAVAETVNNAAEGWVQEGLEDAARWVATTLGKAVAWMLSITISLVFSVTAPNLDAEFMYTWSGRVFAFAIPITILFAFYQIIVTSIQMRGLAGLRRAVGGALFGTVASMLTLPLVAVLSASIDAVKTAFTGYLEVDTAALSQKIVDLWSSETFIALAEKSPTGAAAASVQGISFMLLAFAFFAFFTVLFTFGLLVVMVIRNVMLHGVVVLSPLAWSGLAAEPTREWPRTILGWIMAILFAPLGVVIILGLSISALTDLSSPQTLDELVGQLVLSAAMFLLAFFVPFACFAFFNFMGEAAVDSLHRKTQQGVEEGAQVVEDTIRTTVAAAAAAGAGASTSGGGAGAGESAAGESAAGESAAGESAAGESAAGGGNNTAGVTDGQAKEAAAGPEAGAGSESADSSGSSPGDDSGRSPDHSEPQSDDAARDDGAAGGPASGGPDALVESETSSAWEEV